MRQKQKTRLGFLGSELHTHTEGCVRRRRPTYACIRHACVALLETLTQKQQSRKKKAPLKTLILTTKHAQDKKKTIKIN